MRSTIPLGQTSVRGVLSIKRTLLHHQRGCHSSLVPPDSVVNATLIEFNTYAPYCESIYGWMLHVFTDITKNWKHVCLPCCYNRRSHEIISKRIRVTGDNSCNCSYNALTKIIPEHAILIHVDFTEGLFTTPWAVYIDHELSKVIISIRGSLCLSDALTDMLAISEDMSNHGDLLGFDGTGEYCHIGFWNAALRIYKILKETKLLESLLLGVQTSDDLPHYENYGIIVVGHSLGFF